MSDNEEVKNGSGHGGKGAGRVVRTVLISFLIGLLAGVLILQVRSAKKSDEDEKVVVQAESTITTTTKHEKQVVSIQQVEKVVEQASDLTTTHYKYKDVDQLEDYKTIKDVKIPFTTDSVIYSFEGTIGLGVNLEDITYDIDNDNQVIKVSLPDVTIISNEIDEDSFEYYDVKNSIFNQMEMSDVTDNLANLKQKEADRVLDDEELIDTAEKNTENVIRSFLTAADATKDYSVEFE